MKQENFIVRNLRRNNVEFKWQSPLVIPSDTVSQLQTENLVLC